MGKSTSAKAQVVDYYMSLHFGICQGPVDEVVHFEIEDKIVEFDGGPVTQNGFRNIDLPDLFGGPTKGGGLKGGVAFLFGGEEQVLPAGLSAKFNSPTVPGFRGFLSLFFAGTMSGENYSHSGGFYWVSNSPYLRGIGVKVKRRPRGLDENGMIGDDANPAHIIYECLTNTEWGMGGVESLIDRDSFLAAAQTLRDEEFGLSLAWFEQTKIEDFIQEVLDHISAVFSIDPFTGRLRLKLLRGDYDPDTLPVISPGNAVFSNYQRRSWGETVNEINVTWTNPDNEEGEVVTAHNNANIEIQGGVVSDSRNYYAVRDRDLAMDLAQRDCRAASTPLVSLDTVADRTFWGVRPGDVLRLQWPEQGIDNLVVRVGPVDYGKPGDMGIKLGLAEDIFGLSYAAFAPPASQFEPPNYAPEPLEKLFLSGAPYFLVAGLLGDAAAEDLVYPEALAMLIAAPSNDDIRNIDVLAEGPNLVGQIRFAPVGVIDYQSTAVLTKELLPETSTDIWPLDGLVGFEPRAGELVFFLDPEDSTKQEIAAVEVSTALSLVLRRGVLDTVPLSWPIGTPLWIINPETRIIDRTVRAVGAEPRYKFLPTTSQGRLPDTSAPIETFEIDDRQYRPYRPANVQINGVAWGVVSTIESPVEVTWSRRNRLSETVEALRWDDADVTPESGQTTKIVVTDTDGTVLATHTDLSGTSYDLPVSGFGAVTRIIVQVSSVRDGFESLTAVRRTIDLELPEGGYGLVYGEQYGG